MGEGYKSHTKWITNILVDRGNMVVAIVALISMAMVVLAPRLQMDHSLEGIYDPDSPEYHDYNRFVKSFGNDEFLFFAFKNEAPITNPHMLQALDAATSEIEILDKISKVSSISSLKLPEKRRGVFGAYRLVEKNNGTLFLDEAELARFRNIWPVIDLLVSGDLKTIGIMVAIDEQHVSGSGTAELIATVKRILKRHFPDTGIHVVGTPVLKESILKYNIQTAMTFGLVCVLIGTLVEAYIFRSFRVPIVIYVASGLAIAWGLGLMALMGVKLNSVTALAFGFVLILTTSTVIHIVTHYNQDYRALGNKSAAMKHALATVARPCLMCSLTIAVGFASIMVSSIPSVRQFGMLMSLGAILSFLVTITLVPAIVVRLRPPSQRAYQRMDSDWLTSAFHRLGDFVFAYDRICVLSGVALIGIMILGAPRITIDTRIRSMFAESTEVATDFQFIQSNLVPVESLNLMIEGPAGTFKKSSVWEKLKRLQARLENMPEIERADSFLPILENTAATLTAGTAKPRGLFDDPRIVPQLLFLIGSTRDGYGLLAQYVSSSGRKKEEVLQDYAMNDFNRCAMTLRLNPTFSKDLMAVVRKVKSAAEQELGEAGRITVTGNLALAAAQSWKLIRSQVISLVLALFCITLLLMIQFRSATMGLLSLIPNVLPLATIFGMMGWLGISMNSMTVLVAVISFGFSVDDTIHYLSHFRDELTMRSPGDSVKDCMNRAYNTSAKALISTSAVFFFGCLALAWAPFKPSASFGILTASAALTALIGDLVFMPAVILYSKRVRNLIENSVTGVG